MGKMVIANWKMNGNFDLVKELSSASKLQSFNLNIDLIICPPYVLLPILAAKLKYNRDIQLGAQDVSCHEAGAFTGEVSASMLKEVGCRYVLIGHSERRAYHHETTEIIVEKMAVALKAGLTPVVCIGESLKERQAQQTESVLTQQLEPILSRFQDQFILAYEPIWAIGTGLAATEQEVQETHAFLRQKLYNCPTVPLLYGGSVNAANAAALLAIAEVDGVLVGGASLKVAEITEICQAAHAAG